jgi:EAL domain-containing protein (putative c-di-GMP-specific phosphodiesterase class I)/CheY-like chemotaxis protein
MRNAPKTSQLPLQGRTVLVVEDSTVQRAHAVDLVTRLGADRVLEGCNGVEGMARLGDHAGIDLVLTDLEMPTMDGVRFIGEFAARGYRPELIVISSHEFSVLHSVRLMAETYGLVVPGILAKPLAMVALRQLLNAAPLLVPPARGPAGPAREHPSLLEIEAGIKAGSFTCYFQPQVTFKGALLKGVEALARWRHPEHGVLGPAAFLPQAERDEGIMSALTLAILAEVAGHWHQWHRHGLNLEVSVNLSALSIGTPGFADQLIEACDRLDLPARSVIFEVTESASMSNLGQSLANLARLRIRGFRLSIDDFGTGFATFEQLERIPFTELKIDRSLTQHLPGAERSMIMVRGMLQMAQDLELSTVAEGIETMAAWTALRAMGCDLAQGFLVARPMPGEQIREWAHQDRAHLRA